MIVLLGACWALDKGGKILCTKGRKKPEPSEGRNQRSQEIRRGEQEFMDLGYFTGCAI